MRSMVSTVETSTSSINSKCNRSSSISSNSESLNNDIDKEYVNDCNRSNQRHSNDLDNGSGLIKCLSRSESLNRNKPSASKFVSSKSAPSSLNCVTKEGIHNNTRFMNASNTLVGCPVILKLKSNDTFHGIFVTFSPESDVLLECCHKVEPDNEVIIYGRSFPKKSDVSSRFFKRDTIVEMTALEVDKDFALNIVKGSFTDAAITKKAANSKNTNSTTIRRKSSAESSNEFSKELEPFLFDSENITDTLGNLDDEFTSNQENNFDNLDSDSSNGVGWCAEDMLLINQLKYGYKSTYNADLSEYTVPIHKEDTDEYRRREEEAEKIAQEIESNATYRKNIDKELSDNEDEEEAFSAVVRQPSSSSSRNREINNNTISNKNNNNNFHNQANTNGNSGNNNHTIKENQNNKQEKFSTRRSFIINQILQRGLNTGNQHVSTHSNNMNSSNNGCSNNKQHRSSNQQVNSQSKSQNQSINFVNRRSGGKY